MSKEAAVWSGAAPPLLSRLMTREVAIALAFAVLTFSAYWFLGPKETAYSYQVTQANNILHGHLDLKPEYSRNLGVLERVLYDGERFCLPPGDEDKLPGIVEYVRLTESGVPETRAAQQVISPTCKLYMQHSVGPALIVMPGVLVWGVDLNQALVSAVIGALTAVIVYAIARKLSQDLLTQLALTALMMFGTIFWWVAANGGVWFFAHTTAVFFLFGAVYFTVVRRSPFAAGALLAAAYLCRPPVLMTGLFFVVMFSDLWLRPAVPGKTLLSRIDWRPAVQFAAGMAPLMLLSFMLNYARYDSPLEFGYNYVESSHQTYLAHMYNHGSLDLLYIQRHPPAALGGMPIIQQGAPYILPTWFGMAIWVTTPAFFAIFFANLKKYLPAVLAGAGILALTVAFMVSKAIARAWGTEWATTDPPWGIEYLPFWAMTAVALGAAIYFRDRVSIACWAAIIPAALMLFTFAFVGYAQFGYRYALDFMPFLWLLTAHAVGKEMRWWAWPLIGASITANVWGVLWIYQFQAHQSFGVTEWVVF